MDDRVNRWRRWSGHVLGDIWYAGDGDGCLFVLRGYQTPCIRTGPDAGINVGTGKEDGRRSMKLAVYSGFALWI